MSWVLVAIGVAERFTALVYVGYVQICFQPVALLWFDWLGRNVVFPYSFSALFVFGLLNLSKRMLRGLYEDSLPYPPPIPLRLVAAFMA